MPAPGQGTEEYVPKVDKNPFYKTTEILNGAFKKKVKLEQGDRNQTDGSTIWVNFNEVSIQPIARVELPQEGKYYYTLECGHPWSSKNSYPVGKYIPCWPCGNAQAYLGLEHEWSHIIFKSNIPARKMFVDQYAAALLAQSPRTQEDELKNFLHLFVNAFDDIRVNSLQEKIYPGSAQRIWNRWRKLMIAKEGGYDGDFLSFCLAIGVGLPVDPSGPFYALKPIVEWGMAKARYRGFGTMLLDVRIVIDRCIGAILAQIPPQPPPPPPQDEPRQPQDQGDPQQQEDGDSSDDQDADEDEGGAPPPDAPGGDEEGDDEAGGGDDQQSEQSDESDPQPEPPPPSHVPQADQVAATPEQRESALGSLIKDAEPLDEKEEHPLSDPNEDAYRQSNRAMVAQVFNADVSDLDEVDESMPDDPDTDMQQAIDVVRNAMPEKTQDSTLKDDARAKVTFIDVQPHHVRKESHVELSEEDSAAVERMRATFFRELGRKKEKRDVTGPSIDVQALIQYKLDRKDPSVFEGQDLQRGFAYHVLSDMSGSMGGIFKHVCQAMTILKHSLDFPFVRGEFWGFRGGNVNMIGGKLVSDGDVWLYRYAEKCKGYLGTSPVTLSSGHKSQFPVSCGGITPMNSALRVSIKHMNLNVPAGMAKRLYLLTDGSPVQTKSTGRVLPAKVLRRLVAKEVKWARSHGIEVYVVIIGPSISDEEALAMFGDRRYWKRSNVTGEDSIDVVLCKLIMMNFSKYLKAR